MKKVLAKFFNWISGGWFGEGTEDDFRNPFWRWTEAHKIEVRFPRYKYDWRFGFKENGKWVFFWKRDVKDINTKLWTPGRDANFYNGIFTINSVKITDWNFKNHYRFNLSIRFLNGWIFQCGIGYLPDRGEFGWTGPWVFSIKKSKEHNPGVITDGWDKGPV